MDGDAIRTRAKELPSSPGVYQFLEGGYPIYVGKAVDLRDRVRSYVDPRSYRIGQMVASADKIDVAVTETETQALLLEANLIKRHQPRFNVRLRDDKSYPLIQLTAHPAPRIEVTRDPDDDADVYGPFTDKGRVDTVVKAIRETFGLRGCSDHKYANRDRPCLDYDIGLCSAPCTGEIEEDAYQSTVELVARFLGGETGVLAEPVQAAMEQAAKTQQFERAANLRDRLKAIEAFQEGAAAAIADSDSHREERMDILGVAIEGDRATVARLHSEGGQLVERERHTLAVPEGDQTVASILSAFITQYYAERGLPNVLLCPERPSDPDVLEWLEREAVRWRVPGAGREATLIDLALKNARRGAERDDGTDRLANSLGLDQIERLEGFDISHAQGRATVGSNVVFDHGEPAKESYRRKRLTDGNDDYERMRELLEWRAIRDIEGRDDRPRPDLVIIDGGRGQLEAARSAMAAMEWPVPTVALAKAEETLIVPTSFDRWPEAQPVRELNLDTSDAGLHLCQRVRDEAHRFAVQYHQTVRDSIETVLDDIPGIGPELQRRLLRRFGSVEGIKAASSNELRGVEGVGETTAATIQSRL